MVEEEFKKVPYVARIPHDGRSVPLQPFYDRTDNSWKQFIPDGSRLTQIPAKPGESSYFSETIVDPERDMYLKLADTIIRSFSYQSAMDVRFQITARIIYSAVVLEKYFLSLIRYRNTRDILVTDLVVTDLEFLLANTRMIYDLIQKLFSDLWRRKTGVNLPESFRKVVQRTREDLQSSYGLPEAMIWYYSSSKDFFFKMRALRDAIVHFSANAPPQRFVFCYEDGFAVKKGNGFPDQLALSFDIWPQEKIKPNGHVSVLALISYLNKMVLENTDNFSDALVQAIVPPPAITDSYKLFLRSPYLHHLLKVGRYLDEQWVKGDLACRLTTFTPLTGKWWSRHCRRW